MEYKLVIQEMKKNIIIILLVVACSATAQPWKTKPSQIIQRETNKLQSYRWQQQWRQQDIDNQLKNFRELQESIKKTQDWMKKQQKMLSPHFYTAQYGPLGALNQGKKISFDYYEEGEKLFLTGDIKNAMYYFKQELKNNPKNGRALYYLARIDETKANIYLDVALRCLSYDDWAFRINANSLKSILALEKQDTALAMEHIDTAINIIKNLHRYIRMDSEMLAVYTTARFNRACIWLSRGEMDSAIVDLAEVVNRRGNCEDSLVQTSLLLLVDLHYQLQNYDKAHFAYELLLPCFSQKLDNAALHTLMTDVDLKRGFVSKAIDHFDKAMNCDKDTAWGYLAYCWEEDSTRAIQLFDAWADLLVDKDGNISQDELNIVLISFSERKKYNELVDLYEKRKAFYSDYAPLLLWASYAYADAQELEKAIDIYHVFAKNFNPADNTFGEYYPYTIDEGVVENMNNNTLLCKAILCLRSNSFDSALVILNTLPDSILNEDILPICIFLNNVYKNYDKALLQSNWYIALSHSSDAYSLRGDTYRNKSLLEEANKDYQKVVDLEADSIITWNSAEAYYYLGGKRKAKKIAKELLSSDTLSFDDYWMASLFYETVGKERKAIKYFKEAMKTEHEENYYPIVLMSYDTPSIRKRIEEIINNK